MFLYLCYNNKYRGQETGQPVLVLQYFEDQQNFVAPTIDKTGDKNGGIINKDIKAEFTFV